MASDAVIPCETCGLQPARRGARPGHQCECIRCGSTIVSRPVAGPEATLALTLAALVLYVPANIYPILTMNMYGAYSENTVWDGVVSLMQYGQYFVAAIVFLASIVIPLHTEPEPHQLHERITMLARNTIAATKYWPYCIRLTTPSHTVSPSMRPYMFMVRIG